MSHSKTRGPSPDTSAPSEITTPSAPLTLVGDENRRILIQRLWPALRLALTAWNAAHGADPGFVEAVLKVLEALPAGVLATVADRLKFRRTRERRDGN
ncbi:hypothetical protein ACIO3O_34395 [Streptomyces sp. NPDC087440]|uniref:hypothetical protein n=1 Tax=Streptomyces sp. NPDC087440 TaxID=3365790 RepID=UPI0037F1AEFB